MMKRRQRREALTAVIIDYRKRHYNHRIIFGSPVTEIRRGWRRRLACFAPGQIFAYERWRRNEYGTKDWRIFVCLAIDQGPVTKIPGVMPGADCMLAARGITKVKRAFALFDDLKRLTGPLDHVRADQWRGLHNALESGADDPLQTINIKERV